MQSFVWLHLAHQALGESVRSAEEADATWPEAWRRLRQPSNSFAAQPKGRSWRMKKSCESYCQASGFAGSFLQPDRGGHRTLPDNFPPNTLSLTRTCEKDTHAKDVDAKCVIWQVRLGVSATYAGSRARQAPLVAKSDQLRFSGVYGMAWGMNVSRLLSRMWWRIMLCGVCWLTGRTKFRDSKRSRSSLGHWV